MSPAEPNLDLIKLRGENSSTEFWGQNTAVAELEHQLRNILCASTIFEGVEFRRGPDPPGEDGSKGSRRWGKSKKTADEVPLAHPPKNSSGVQLSVVHEDIIIRTTTPFGLYETATKPGVVVRVDVIC